MKKYKWMLHPVSLSIYSLLALGLSLFLYIHWYLSARDAFTVLVARYNVDARQFLTVDTWVIILILSLLVAIILMGMLLIFIYYQKIISLYRQQQNFINGFTHELKTPITSLRLYLDTFRLHELSRSDQLKYLELMVNDVSRLATHVESILELGKIELGGTPDQLGGIPLREKIESIVQNERLQHPDATIIFNPPAQDEENVLIFLEMKHFQIICSNLVKNAIGHNRQDRPSVEISIATRGKKASIRFSDNGVGIDKKEHKKIFRKFYQVGKVSKGTGLGLYIVYQILRLYHGKITVLSEGLGKGSVFEVILPCKRV